MLSAQQQKFSLCRVGLVSWRGRSWASGMALATVCCALLERSRQPHGQPFRASRQKLVLEWIGDCKTLHVFGCSAANEAGEAALDRPISW